MDASKAKAYHYKEALLTKTLRFIENDATEEELKALRKAINKRLKPVGGKIIAQWTSRDMELAHGLYELVKRNYSFIPDANDQLLISWATDINKLVRLDGYDPKLVEAVIRWSQQDEFWRQNVRSGGALRKHFVKMLVKIKETKAAKGGVYSV